MFKYIKTLGAHASAPEILIMHAESGVKTPYGAVFTLENGRLSSILDHTKMKYVTVGESPGLYGTSNPVPCIPVLPGMLFEVNGDGLSNVKPGQKVSFANQGDFVTEIYNSESDYVEVVDCTDFDLKGKVVVTFHV